MSITTFDIKYICWAPLGPLGYYGPIESLDTDKATEIKEEKKDSCLKTHQ